MQQTKTGYAVKAAWLAELVSDLNRNGCRDWPWPLCPLGYPRPIWTSTTTKTPPSHLLLTLDGRPKPEGETFALHSCDRRLCLAPWHLRWGTRAENMADMVARRRARNGFTAPRLGHVAIR